MHRRAFTLIELLVVIAIIAILAAILFPVFAQAKQAAKKAADLSNQKQLTLAVIMYQGDYDDVMPVTVPGDRGTDVFTTPWDRTPSANPALRQSLYTNSISPYVKNWQIWTSPARATDWAPVQGDPGPNNPNPTGFAMSYTMNSYLNCLSAGSLQAPSSVIVIWNGIGTTTVPGWGFAMPLIVTKSNGYLAPGQFPGDAYLFQNAGPDCVSTWGSFSGVAGTTAKYDVFAGGMNVGDADGHAKFAKIGSPNNPVKTLNPDGTLNTWRTDLTDGPNGCNYPAALSPFRAE
ncbi:MAG TPA: prepilin-type N-terminal cleavage/methylation domain-containing protein [Fimbriimonadaceae bacterium]|nr:prepilin-type N-terminal cleavage/methylation domain-containing protein [Fimbriimonadaceae bacterium]